MSILSVQEISKSYKLRKVVKALSLEIKSGEVVGLLGASGMTITPTVGIYGAYGMVAFDDPGLFDDDRVRTFVPWAPEAARRPGDPDVMRALVRDMSSLGRRVVEAGGTVVVGTDSPIIPQGLSLVAEMQALVDYTIVGGRIVFQKTQLVL
mgnify:CR=1 FL=1